MLAAGGLELVDVAVHPTGRRRPERAGRVALRRLGRSRVVHAMVLQVARHRPTRVESLLDLGVGDVAGHDHRSGQHDAGAHRVLRELGADLVHRPGEVDVDDRRTIVLVEVVVGDVGQEPRRIAFELLEEDPVAGDLAERLPVGRARHGHRHRAARAVAGETDDTNVVAEVLATELGTDPGGLGEPQHLALEVDVAERVPCRRAGGREGVEVLRRGQLRRLDRVLGRRPADHDGQVVRRAGRRPQGLHLVEQPGQQRRLVQQRLGLLVQVALVGAAAALGDEQELVLVAVRRRDLDLGGEVVAGVAARRTS